MSPFKACSTRKARCTRYSRMCVCDVSLVCFFRRFRTLDHIWSIFLAPSMMMPAPLLRMVIVVQILPYIYSIFACESLEARVRKIHRRVRWWTHVSVLLRSRRQAPSYLVVASDGVWDSLKPEAVFRLVRLFPLRVSRDCKWSSML